jgi:isopentenyl-diphosphate delta-isomerase
MNASWQVPPNLVQLVDESGQTVGEADLSDAHTPPGCLHRGFSVFLIDSWARLLIQRRSAVRLHSAGLWTSSCCGHPLPGESPFRSAWRQLGEELGMEALGLNEVGAVRYKVSVPGMTEADRMVEYEWHHVFVGMALYAPSPDPLEVAEHSFVPLDEVNVALERMGFASWIPASWQVAFPFLSLMTGRSATPRRSPQRADQES